MRKRVHIVLAVLLIATAGVILWHVLQQREREPVYHGKPAGYWMNCAFPPPDGAREFNAIWNTLGTNAVPFLVKALEKKDGPIQKTYYKFLPKLPTSLKRVLPKAPLPTWIIRTRAASALGLVGKDSRPASAAILNAMRTDEDPQVRTLAANVLKAIDPPAAAKAGVK